LSDRWLAASDDAEVKRDDVVCRRGLLRAAAEDDRSGIDDDDIVRKAERKLDVLLDQQDRLTFGFELCDGAADLGDEPVA